MLKITSIIDDKKCYEEVRKLRWPNEIDCPHCGSAHVIKNGHDETQAYRQRYECKSCRKQFDDLTNTVFANHHQPLKIKCFHLN
jgi:transposase-like protein